MSNQPTIEFLNRIYAASEPCETHTENIETSANRAIPVFLMIALPALTLGCLIGLGVTDVRYEAANQALKNKLETTQAESVERAEKIKKQQTDVTKFCQKFGSD